MKVVILIIKNNVTIKRLGLHINNLEIVFDKLLNINIKLIVLHQKTLSGLEYIHKNLQQTVINNKFIRKTNFKIPE